MKKSEIIGSNNSSADSKTTKKPTGVRAFLASRNRIPIKQRSSPVFHDSPHTNDLSANVVKTARKSGVLNLSSRNLTTIPPKVFKINDLDENEKSAVSVSLDNPSEEKWWEFVDLQKLIVANNGIMEIPSDIGRLMSLQTFDAHDNQIERVANEISALEHLLKLNLSQNKIVALPSGLYKLKRLTELKLSHNRIEELSSDIINFSSLLFLDVSNNHIKQLPDDIGYLSFLTTLNISNNRLKQLPPDIGSLNGLRSLDVSENCLTSVPDISHLTHLEILYLRKNKLTRIPNVAHCAVLKELYMQNNLVNYFDSEVFAYTKIQLIDFRCNKIENMKLEKDHLEFVDRLYLDNNDICVLPDDLCFLPSLKSLTLDGNPLRGIRIDILQRGTTELLKYLRTKVNASEKAINRRSLNSDHEDSPPPSKPSTSSSSESNSPRGISNISDLGIDRYKIKATRLLNLTSKNIKAIDDEVFEVAGASQVNVIDICRNQLTQLPNSIVKCGEFLTELKLDGNRLTSLPKCIGISCTRLQFLSFQSNQISDLPPEFSDLKNLREINFSYNRMQDFPLAVYDMKKLEIIIAADNKINIIDTVRLSDLKRLAVLDLRNNNLTQLPPELGLMTQLRSLLVEGNAFKVPGYQILSKGTEELLLYLRNRIVK